MTILIEALRQINIQYAGNENLINRITEQISELIFNNNYFDSEESDFNNVRDIRRQSFNASSASTRSYIYNTLEDIISEYDMEISSIGNKPILIVFDSFEEMQYKASSSELHSFFSFIQEISSKIPRVRPIFAGRSELGVYVKNIKFQTLLINDFDSDSAKTFLSKCGVKDNKVKDLIYRIFGGNPLMLNLATNLIKKDDFNIKEVEKIKGAKWQYLVNRILGHIRDEKVRKIAVPGMLVRYVNIDVIKEILAQPTKLYASDNKEIRRIFDELKKEVSLISKSTGGNEFSFRQDLRMMCEDMIVDQYPEESKTIRQNAIDYYSKYDTIKNTTKRKKHQAEYYFHQMKSGEIPQDLTPEVYEELHSYLEQSIIELPKKSMDYLNLLTRKHINTNENKEQYGNDLWERNYIGIIHDALRGEFSYMQEVYNQVISRQGRLNDGFTEFGKNEALLYQRMNDIDRSNTVIDQALNYKKNNKVNKSMRHFDFELNLIRIQNYEYQQRYEKAFSLCKKIEQKKLRVAQSLRFIYTILFYRIQSRLNSYTVKPDFFEKQESFTWFRYTPVDNFIDIKWRFISNNMNLNNINFKEHNHFDDEYGNLAKTLNGFSELEDYSRKVTGSFVKDVTNTGHFNIVLRDLLLAKEVIKNEKT